MLRFRYARLLLVCCLPLVLPTFARSDAPTKIPDGAQILKELLSRRDSVDNLAVEAIWEEYEEGKPSAWEEERVYRDNLGRIRVRYYHGTGKLGTGKKHMVDDVFDGEITANVLTDPTRNRLGELLKSGKTTDSKNCYRAAIIHDGVLAATVKNLAAG